MAKKKNELVDRDHGWRAMMARAKAADRGAYVKVGVLADSEEGGLHQKGPDGKAAPLTVAEIAAVQEFGTKDGHVPKRSFIRSTFDRLRFELQEAAGKLLVKVVVDGSMTMDDALGILGLKLSAAMKRAITDGGGIRPANAPSTIAAKGSAHTLVDTGRMLGAIGWAVVRAGVQGAFEKPKGRRQS